MTDYSAGECPDDEPVPYIPEDLYAQRVAERARRELFLGAVKAHLEEQPSPGAVHAAVRHWISDITALGEDVARKKRSTS
ncbi:hypothetical protein ACIQVK_03675 [Streptomyces sp. NPDC090493]|uniref:hypothetical protein n=1 Tax=Streptomyces sp. NPDC090493 TaxID=3365964 RepID=UPI0037F3AEE2